jgi:hypothetical protein
MRNFSRFVAAVAGLACAASLAFADEQTILGKVLLVKNPGDASQRKIAAVGNEKGSPNTIAGDPTLDGSAGGAILEVVVFKDMTTSYGQAFVLPSGTSPTTHKPFWSPLGTTGFKYRDPKAENGAVKFVRIKRTPSGKFVIKAKIRGKNGPVDVIPPNPGISGCVALKIGMSSTATGDRYSIQFGVDSFVQNSGSKLFKAKRPKLEGVCPSVATTTTTTLSSTTSTTMYGSPSRAFLTRPVDLLD